MAVLIELKKGDRVAETRAGLRDRVYVAHDRFRRMLLISGAVPPLVETINRLATSPLDKVWHQSLYACANGKIKSGVHKGWRCEALAPRCRVQRINELLEFTWGQVGILSDDPDDWVIVRSDARQN